MTIPNIVEMCQAGVPIVEAAVDNFGLGGAAAIGAAGAAAYEYSMNAPPNEGGTSKRVKREPQVTTDARTGKCKKGVKRKRVACNVSSLISGRAMFDAHLLPVLGEKQLTTLRVKCGNREYPDQMKSFLDMCLGVSAKTRTSFAGRITTPHGVRTYHHELYRHNYTQNDNDTPSSYPSALTSAGRILTPQTNINYPFDPKGTGTGSYDTSFRDMSDGFTPGHVYYANYNRTDLEDLSWNQQRIRLAENDSTSTNPPTWVVAGAAVPQLQNDLHKRWGAIAKINDSAITDTPIRGLFKACINYGKVTYNFMNKGEGGAEVTVVVSKFKKGHLMSSNGAHYHSNTYPLVKSTTAIGNGWLQTMKANYSVQDFNGRDAHASDVTTNPCFPFLPQLAKTKQAEVDIKEVSRQSFAMPSGSRRDLIIDLPGEVFNPLDFPISSTSSGTPQGRGIVNDMTYCITIAVNGTKATRFVQSTADTAQAKDEGGFAVGDMHGPANIQYYSTYEECVGPSTFTCEKKILLANEGGLMNPTDEFSTGYFQKTGVMLSQSASVRVAPKVIKHYNTSGAHHGTNVEDGKASVGNQANERR